MSTITSTGLGSGLDISGLTTKLVAAEKAPQSGLLTRQADTLTAKISALGSFKSAVSGFQSSLSALSSPTAFNAFSTTSSNESIVTASALSNADAGTYQVQVEQLAQRHALASSAYANASDVVGTGTLTIQLGTDPTSADFAVNPDQGTLTLTIDSSNNSLTGIRDAINAKKAGVTAALVNDGTGYRLTLSATDSGVKNALRITADSADGLSALNYNATAQNLDETQTAEDAKLKLNGLSIISSNNAVSTALKGVTLNLEQAQPGTSVTVKVQTDTSAITTALEGFVKTYNELQTTLKSVASYDAETQTASALFGDTGVQGTMSKLRTALNASVPGLSGSVTRLTDVGITTQADGTFSLDTTKLNKVLASNPEGVKGLFSMVGQSFSRVGPATDPGVAYVKAASDTQAGQYAINVTQAATQGVLNSGVNTSLTVDASNDVFQLKVDGVQSGDITLTAGTTYTGTSLAAEIQSRINADAALQAKAVSVQVTYDTDNNSFVFTSASYGSSSAVAITQVESGASALGLEVASSAPGLDVAGTIAGQPTTGNGQLLTSTGGNAKGLQLQITGTTTGDRGTVTLSSPQPNPDVAYVKATNDTKPGEYAIKVTRAAAQGTLTGGVLSKNGKTDPLTIDGTNNVMRIKVDGIQSGDIALTAGTTYTGNSLAAEIQSRINGDSQLKASGLSVAVTYDSGNNKFIFKSKTYGSASQVDITQAGSGASALGLQVATGTAGLDVAGTIDGLAATGKGQLLTAASGNAKGLQLLIADSKTGERGSVNFSRGMMDSLNTLLTAMLDSKNGTLTAQNKTLQDALTQNTKEQKELDTRMDAFEVRLLKQFNAMDAMVASLKSTSDSLTQALGSLPYNNLNSN